jgi:sterol desaturase/sphingolipid hydroxylase (fatty acid hydroxylase superfamily)
MSLPDLSFLADFPGAALAHLGGKLAKLFLSVGTYSLASWLTALCVAILFLGLRRPRRRRQIRAKVLLRALFPRKILHSPSSAADVGFFLFNFFLAGALFGGAIVSYHFVSNAVGDGLAGWFGTPSPSSLPRVAGVVILTVALFLAYELGYWIDHYLSHHIPFLWEFHKVHHQAEVLSPLTTFRVHPVDSIVFYNIQTAVMGITGGAVNYALGTPVTAFTIADSNVFVLVFTYLVGHLQHSHFWIVFHGIWGRMLLSPAHHQIHHSTNPAHFNRNFGAALGVWDWLFGTLYVPSKKREKLIFGVEPKAGTEHGLHEGIVAPVWRAWALVTPMRRLREGFPQTNAGANAARVERQRVA